MGECASVYVVTVERLKYILNVADISVCLHFCFHFTCLNLKISYEIVSNEL